MLLFSYFREVKTTLPIFLPPSQAHEVLVNTLHHYLLETCDGPKRRGHLGSWQSWPGNKGNTGTVWQGRILKKIQRKSHQNVSGSSPSPSSSFSLKQIGQPDISEESVFDPEHLKRMKIMRFCG